MLDFMKNMVYKNPPGGSQWPNNGIRLVLKSFIIIGLRQKADCNV